MEAAECCHGSQRLRLLRAWSALIYSTAQSASLAHINLDRPTFLPTKKEHNSGSSELLPLCRQPPYSLCPPMDLFSSITAAYTSNKDWLARTGQLGHRALTGS